MTKKVIRLKGCICFDESKTSVEEIIAALQKFGKMYAIVVISETSLKDTPAGWIPNQKSLNGFKRE